MRIEGASEEQRGLLEEILAGMPETRIEALRVGPVERGLELVLDKPRSPDLRTTWETVLVAHAFRDLAQQAVVWVRTPDEGHTLEHADHTGDVPERRELEEAVHAAAAQTGAIVERVEILEPLGRAVAVSLAVPEPHGFLRHGFAAFRELSGHWDRRRDGSYLEILDGGARPVERSCTARGWGGGGPRADVECCAPSRRRGIHAPGPPPCAVTPRTFDDMFAAFRANLAATTRFGLDEWLELLAAEGVRSADAFHWLRREHGLGDATAAAIATAVQPP